MCRVQIPRLSASTRAFLPCTDFVGGGRVLNRVATCPPLMTLRIFFVACDDSAEFFFLLSGVSLFPQELDQHVAARGDGAIRSWGPGLPLFFCQLALRSWVTKLLVFDSWFERAQRCKTNRRLRTAASVQGVHVHRNGLDSVAQALESSGGQTFSCLLAILAASLCDLSD